MPRLSLLIARVRKKINMSFCSRFVGRLNKNIINNIKQQQHQFQLQLATPPTGAVAKKNWDHSYQTC